MDKLSENEAKEVRFRSRPYQTMSRRTQRITNSRSNTPSPVRFVLLLIAVGLIKIGSLPVWLFTQLYKTSRNLQLPKFRFSLPRFKVNSPTLKLASPKLKLSVKRRGRPRTRPAFQFYLSRIKKVL